MKPPFLLGDWLVSPDTNSIARGELMRRMEPRLMDVLIALAERAQEVVSSDQLLLTCWGSTLYGDGPVHKTIAQLRRMLDDSATAPRYIATIRKRGYQLVAVPLPLAPQLPPVRWQGSPFRGLHAFGEQDAAIFFGRDGATQSLLQAVRERIQQGMALQVILGPSGSGKTSLVCAGLLPALMAGDAPDVPAVLSSAHLDLREIGAQSLLNAVAATLLDWQLDDQPAFPGASAVSLGRRLASEAGEVAAELRDTLQARRTGARAPMLALFIDSFEAALTAGEANEAQLRLLLQVLEWLAGSGAVLVLLACRNDYYPRLAAYPLLISCKQRGGHFDLEPPTRAEIAQIISLPAQAAGLRFEQDPDTLEGLDLVLAKSAAHNPDALPLLQYVLEELYRLRTEDGMLGFSAFRQLGGLEAAIGHRAEQVVQALTERERASLARVLSLVVALSDDDEQIGSRRVAWADLREDSERELVKALVEARLFVSELMDQQPGFGVAHEAVLRRWPRVLDWITEHRLSLRVHAHLARQAARWCSEGRPADLLLPPGKLLNEARSLVAVLPLSEQELALIQLSNRRATRGARLRLGIVLLLLVLSTLAAGAGLLAVRANGLAQQRREELEGLVSFMLGDFADKLRPLARLDLLDAVSAKAMTYLSGASADAATPAALAQQAQALQVIAEVRIARGDSRAAEQALQAARAILERQMALAPADHQLWQKRGTNAFWLGKISMEQNQWSAAQAQFEQYRDDSEKWFAAEPDNVDAWVELSYALNTLGTLALKRSDTAQAMALFARSVELKTRALQRKPHDRRLAAELADSLSWVASAKENLGQLGEALQLYQRELDIVLRIREAGSGEALWQNRMAIALQHLASLKLVRGDWASALKDWQYAESLLNGLLELEPGNRVWQRNRALVQLEQQRVLAYHQAPAQTLARLQAIGNDINELLRLEPKKAEWLRLQAVAQQRSASLLLRLQRHHEAQLALAASEEKLQGLLAANRADARSRDALVQTLLTKADLRRTLRDGAAAVAACLQAESLLPASSRQSRDFRVLDPWVRTQLCQGKSDGVVIATNNLEQMGYSEQAFKYFLSNHK